MNEKAQGSHTSPFRDTPKDEKEGVVCRRNPQQAVRVGSDHTAERETIITADEWPG